MLEKISGVYIGLTDYMNGFLAAVCVVLLIVAGLALGLGLLLVLAWILMEVYNVLAAIYHWPTFSIWFWLGVEIVVNWLRTGKLPIALNLTNKEKE